MRFPAFAAQTGAIGASAVRCGYNPVGLATIYHTLSPGYNLRIACPILLINHPPSLPHLMLGGKTACQAVHAAWHAQSYYRLELPARNDAIAGALAAAQVEGKRASRLQEPFLGGT